MPVHLKTAKACRKTKCSPGNGMTKPGQQASGLQVNEKIPLYAGACLEAKYSRFTRMDLFSG